MESLLSGITGYLYAVGPVVVFVVAGVETAFFIGLLVPAEATILVAGFLAAEGVFSVQSVLAATILGALAGDQFGYVLGRFGGRRFAARGGRVARLWARSEPRATAMFRRRTIVAVTLARFVSFVRTLMPWFAGMTRMPWPRFFVFDLLGVVGWGTASVFAGYLAGESWEALAAWLGRASAVIIFVLGAGLGVTALLRRKARRRAEASPVAETGALVAETGALVAEPVVPAAEPTSAPDTGPPLGSEPADG